jgi:hypothetical protein
MNNFAGNFFKSAFKATAFNKMPKYSSSYLKTSVHKSSIDCINMYPTINSQVDLISPHPMQRPAHMRQRDEHPKHARVDIKM